MELHHYNGLTYIFKAEDWMKLRTKHHIVGDMVGLNSQIPSLPIVLMPEEAILLVEEEIATISTFPDIFIEPSQQNKNEFSNAVSSISEELQNSYKETRRSEILQNIDKIIAGKKAKGLSKDAVLKESIVEKELAKSEQLGTYREFSPIFLSHPQKLTAENVDTKFLERKTTPLRRSVFKNLWKKGYYITNGLKFGGDFLIYPGDPTCFHSSHIVICVENSVKSLAAIQLTTFCRVGTAVKKDVILAFLDQDEVCFLKLNWCNIT